MNICIVGGIFGKDHDYRAKHRFAPEVVLSDGLGRKGHEVAELSHRAFVPSSRFDVVHVHHLASGAVRMASGGSFGKFVFTPHSGALISNYKVSLQSRLWFKYVLSKCDAIVALSGREAEFYERSFPGKVIAIPNGIPAEVFTLPKLQVTKAQEKYHIVCVAQLLPAKGIDTLIRAMGLLVSEVHLTLSLVYHTETYESHYRQMADDMNLSESVHFSGFLSASEVARVYQQSDLTVLPSYAEALPSVLTESLLCGTPVVATSVGGIPEQIGRFGITVEPGNSELLAKAILNALRSPLKTPAMSKAMREYALEKFQVESMVNKHENLYMAVLGSGRTRPAASLLDNAINKAMTMRQ